ncbi:MAG TPA: hypothetical protein DDX91_04540 [Ruminococcaceae bacterium]|nr:hypothetical protein [Oscillospiraceae bacterium]
MQNLYDSADIKAMKEVIDSRGFSDFCGVDSVKQIPDGEIGAKLLYLFLLTFSVNKVIL